jgi:hypothetical protein
MREICLNDLAYVADLKSRVTSAAYSLETEVETPEVVVEILKDIVIDFIEFEKAMEHSFVQEGMVNRKNRLNADTLAGSR